MARSQENGVAGESAEFEILRLRTAGSLWDDWLHCSSGPRRIRSFTDENGLAIEVLVNNAGFGAYRRRWDSCAASESSCRLRAARRPKNSPNTFAARRSKLAFRQAQRRLRRVKTRWIKAPSSPESGLGRHPGFHPSRAGRSYRRVSDSRSLQRDRPRSRPS
jgi:hypothetical protein